VAPLREAEAVELFCERSQLGRDETVAAICRRLDCLPLAVELAAARTSVLSLRQILERLPERLDLFRGARDVEARQRTLRATIAWSYDLLPPAERHLFPRLSVFVGGSTLEAACEVCGATLDDLESLVDKNLLRHTGDRFWMLETIREFALDQLADSPSAEEVWNGWADYYLGLAGASDRDLRGPDQAAAFKRLGAERDNFRAALTRLLDRDPLAALRLVAALWGFWWMRGYSEEGGTMLLDALERADHEPTEARASALVGAGVFAYAPSQVQVQESTRLLQDGLTCARTAGSTRIEINALSLLSIYSALGRRNRIRLGEDAINLARAYGDRWLLGLVTGNHGVLMGEFGETEESVELMSEAYRLCRGVGDTWRAAQWLSNLGWSALCAGDSREARTKLNESLRLARGIENDRTICASTMRLGWADLLDEDHDGARSRFEEAAEIARRLGRGPLGAMTLWGFAQVTAARGDADRAARLAGAASALHGPGGFDPTETIRLSRHAEDARAALGEYAWQNAWADGSELDLDDALGLALGE
jgi:tetratricopeptide (TPR) repeat protein